MTSGLELHDPAMGRCLRYRATLGLPVVVMPALGRIILYSGPVGGLVVPARVAGLVQAVLTAHGRPGPVIAHPRSGSCTILTGPADGYEYVVADVLLRLNAGAASDWIVLPSPTDERSGYRRWNMDPHNGFHLEMREVFAIPLELAA
ncbi:hypothetical protein [Nocardia sp. CNY236]|uniref:hypothetical protein n=1 Tax=Nocardia sp. CNY236 TaxID=1169152 RepID=UPI000688D543|nr:hypothetical protein [Nocardia sp. CNY236]